MCSEKEKHEIDRRLFLKKMITGGIITATNPLQMMLANYFTSFMGNGLAHAAGTSFDDSILINLTIDNGAARWFWDYSMTPNGSGDPLVPNPMVINRFVSDGKGGVIGKYETTQVGNYQMPYLWNSMIPTSSGGSVSMKVLAPYLLNMRGIGLPSDGHGVNGALHIAPIVGGNSITGMVADAATTLIPALNFRSYKVFKSPKGLKAVESQSNGPNTLSTILSPFLPLGGNISNMLSLSSSSVDSEIDKILGLMSAQATSKHKYLPTTYDNVINAKKLIKKNFGNLQTVYNTLLAKYTNLIVKATSDKSFALAGLDDLAVPGDPTGMNRYLKTGEKEVFAGSDMRTIIQANSGIGYLAASMAVAEFMLVNQLSSSLNLWSTEMMGNFSATVPLGGGTGRQNFTATINNDTHEFGAYGSLIMWSKYFQGLSACLWELIQVLQSTSNGKGGNLWGQTVCLINSDFNRAARSDGSGADHGFWGDCYTLLSGRITNGPIILGNTKSDPGNHYGGSWGIGAPVPEFSNRIASIGNAVSTVAQILEVPTPVPNDPPFLTYKNGKISYIVKGAKAS